MTRTMVSAFATMTMVAGLAMPASAQSASGKFLCEAEVGGGIFFDTKSKRWDSNGFVPDAKFVATITHIPTPPNVPPGAELFTYYEVEIAEFGSQALPCVTGGDFLFGHTTAYESHPIIFCDTLVHSYRIDPRSLRFLQVYPYGYVDGKDEEGNTPSIMAGKCARLE